MKCNGHHTFRRGSKTMGGFGTLSQIIVGILLQFRDMYVLNDGLIGERLAPVIG